MPDIYTPPDESLVRLIADLERRVRTLERLPSGLNSIGVQHLQPWTKAGAPSDADFVAPPQIGTVVYDTSGSKLWVRHAPGSWKSVAVA